MVRGVNYQSDSEFSDTDSEPAHPTTAGKRPITTADLKTDKSAEKSASKPVPPRSLEEGSSRLRVVNRLEKSKHKKTLLRTVDSVDVIEVEKDPRPLTDSAATRLSLIHDRQERKKTKNVETFTCKICFVEISGKKEFRKFLNRKCWNEHLASKAHTKRLVHLNEKTKNLFCTPCQRRFRSQHDLNSHRNSANHRRNLHNYRNNLR